MNYSLNNASAFLQDNWRWKPTFTVRAGLKWEYYSPLQEDDNLALFPVLDGRRVRDVLLDPNGRVSFRRWRVLQQRPEQLRADDRVCLGSVQGRPYRRSRRLLADVRQRRDDERRPTMRRTRMPVSRPSAVVHEPVHDAGGGYPGPSRRRSSSASGPTPISSTLPPDAGGIRDRSRYQAAARSSDERGRYARAAVVSGRRGAVRRHIRARPVARDRPQPDEPAWRIPDDFLRARTNGFLALQATGVFDPAFNPAIAGSQPLTVIPDVRRRIPHQRDGPQPDSDGPGCGARGSVHDQRRIRKSARRPDRCSSPNPGHLCRRSDSQRRVHQLPRAAARTAPPAAERNDGAGQLHARRAHARIPRARRRSASSRSSTTRARSSMRDGPPFHVTHVINANFIAELPFGMGKRWMNRGGL